MNPTNSLTARLMSRSGLNPIDPTLPPVHNMRLITLSADMTPAEKHLHAARKALSQLEEARATKKSFVTIKSMSNNLYIAMDNLAWAEEKYFARSKLGYYKPVLHGWGQRKFTEVIERLHNAIVTAQGTKNMVTVDFNLDAVNAWKRTTAAVTSLKNMNNACYHSRAGTRKSILPIAQLRLYKTYIEDHAKLLRQFLNNTQALPDTDPTKANSLEDINYLLDETMKQVVLPMAESIVSDRWDIPPYILALFNP